MDHTDKNVFTVRQDPWYEGLDNAADQYQIVYRHNAQQSSSFEMTLDRLHTLAGELNNFLIDHHRACEHWCTVAWCFANCKNLDCEKCGCPENNAALAWEQEQNS